MEQWSNARHPPGADGIIPGAAAIDRAGSGQLSDGVLALHGFGDTPQTLAVLADGLAARGWAVRVPLLPGHGRTLKEFARTSADDWIAAARGEYAAMRARYDRVVLVGLSMGGALATILSGEGDSPAALVLLAPYLAMPRPLQVFARMSRLAALWTPYVGGRGGDSIRDPIESARNLAYGATAPRLVAELASVVERARAAAPAVRAPTLMVQSRQDNRIAAADAEAAFQRLGSTGKELVWVDDGRHIITVDVGRDAVIRIVADWLAGRLPAR
jgi:carboxylesterase